MTAKPILRALAGDRLSSPPVWLMRQAGRHLPEYRKLRAEVGGFLNLVCDSKRAAEATLQPVRRYGMDGSILFSDILVIPWALGQSLWFETGEGPKLGDLPENLDLDMETLSPIFETLNLLNVALSGTKVTQLGFVGAPWTVATYMIEKGKPQFQASKDFLETSKAKPLFRILIDATIAYAKAQVAAGAEVIKIFDSWASELVGDQLKQWSLDPMIEIGEALSPTPIIYFPRNSENALPYMRQQTTEPFGFALGERASLRKAREMAGPDICLQGNLSPATLLGPEKVQEQKVAEILSFVRGTPHIFNLGHGVDKTTDFARVQALVDQVRAG